MKPLFVALLLLTTSAQAQSFDYFPKAADPQLSPQQVMHRNYAKFERNYQQLENERQQIYMEGRIKRVENELYLKQLLKSY